MNSLQLDIVPETIGFFECGAFQTNTADDTIIRKPPGLFSYVIHTTLRWVAPFRPAPFRTLGVDYDFARRFLPPAHQVRVNRFIKQCDDLAQPAITKQHDQDVILIHGRGQGIPLHVHGITDGHVAFSHCVKLTDIPWPTPIFEIEGISYPAFEDGWNVSRFIFNTRDCEHQVIVDPADPNLYMWYVKDGCDTHAPHLGVTVTRHTYDLR